MRQNKNKPEGFRGLTGKDPRVGGSAVSSARGHRGHEDEIEGENLGRIRAVIEREKESALAQFPDAKFRGRLVSRLGANGGEPSRSAARRRSARAFLLSRPVAAAALGAVFIALLAALWFFVLSPSPQPESATLHDNILEVLLQSSSSPRPAAGPSAAVPPPRQAIPAPRPTPDREIPVIVFKVLEGLIPGRPAPETPAVEEERASPTPDKLQFHEMLKRIKEA
jgi:hypothetical protein